MIRALLIAAGIVAGAAIAPPPSAVAGPPYRNCTEAHNDGRYNIPRDDPAYSPKLDRDGDGYACEPKPR
ncbi:excalibur calcium-binding domain-containing protein [Mycobacterium sp. pUA109]|uniref:excalibur calcium-binding domain-containing protein n=1 Tax=Mycobacterium sp. pUA109 TaxID=3238982 RepID=UPI00351B56F2